MPFQPVHDGLFFTSQHIAQAHKNRSRDPLLAAWTFLSDASPPPESLAALHWQASRCRLLDDAASGEKAVNGLQNFGFHPGLGYRELVGLAQTIEMLRAAPGFHTGIVQDFEAAVLALNNQTEALSFTDELGLALVNLTAGIVLEDEGRFQHSADAYRRCISQEIRPEGYMPRAVEGDAGSFQHQLAAVESLILMAEAASHAGVDLWSYAVRGISVVTAASYLIYYYYYPEAWRWGEISPEESSQLFRQQGACFEILNHRARPRDIRLMLDDLRPLYAPAGGGLTTLTHAPTARRGLFR